MQIPRALNASMSSMNGTPLGSVVKPKMARRAGSAMLRSPVRSLSSRSGMRSGGLGTATVGSHKAPQVGLPAVVRRQGSAGAVNVVAGCPGEHELGPAHCVAVEEVGETPGPAEPGRTPGKDA